MLEGDISSFVRVCVCVCVCVGGGVGGGLISRKFTVFVFRHKFLQDEI